MLFWWTRIIIIQPYTCKSSTKQKLSSLSHKKVACLYCWEGLSWSWSWWYGSWIYKYMYNQHLSPLKLWVWILLMARHTWYNITWCDKVWLTAGRWFYPGTAVSSTNKTDCHDITEILLKVALKTISSSTLNNVCKQTK